LQDTYLNGNPWFLSQRGELKLAIESAIGLGDRWTLNGPLGYLIQDSEAGIRPPERSAWVLFDEVSGDSVTHEDILMTCNECKLSNNGTIPTVMTTESPTPEAPSAAPVVQPSSSPSPKPSDDPTPSPTLSPSDEPTPSPTLSPTTCPSATPSTSAPTTPHPSSDPSKTPTNPPSLSLPSTNPTRPPVTSTPTAAPSASAPTAAPTMAMPTITPTNAPSGFDCDTICVENAPASAVLYLQDTYLNGYPWFLSARGELKLNVDRPIGLGERWTLNGPLGYLIQDSELHLRPPARSDWVSFDDATGEITTHQDVYMTCNSCILSNNGTIPTIATTTQPPTTPEPSKTPSEQCGYFDIACEPNSPFDGLYVQSATNLNQRLRWESTTNDALIYWEGLWVISTPQSDIRLTSTDDVSVPSAEIWQLVDPSGASDTLLCSIQVSVCDNLIPSNFPSSAPIESTYEPSLSPSESTSLPSREPSTSTYLPSKQPITSPPTNEPSKQPITSIPTNQPSKQPITSIPTNEPSNEPTGSEPTFHPVTSNPTKSPSSPPTPLITTIQPSTGPVFSTLFPSNAPVTSSPSQSPDTSGPTELPSTNPSMFPTPFHCDADQYIHERTYPDCYTTSGGIDFELTREGQWLRIVGIPNQAVEVYANLTSNRDADLQIIDYFTDSCIIGGGSECALQDDGRYGLTTFSFNQTETQESMTTDKLHLDFTFLQVVSRSSEPLIGRVCYQWGGVAP